MTKDKREALMQEALAIRATLLQGTAGPDDRQMLRDRYEEIRRMMDGESNTPLRAAAKSLLKEVGGKLKALEQESAPLITPVPEKSLAFSASPPAEPQRAKRKSAYGTLRLYAYLWHLLAGAWAIAAIAGVFAGWYFAQPYYFLGAIGSVLAMLASLTIAAVIQLLRKLANDSH